MSQPTSSTVFSGRMRPPGGLVGGLPRKMLEDRMELTKIDEDPEAMDRYRRSTLSDFGPDAAAFEFEAPRKDRAGAVMSSLNLRHTGSRYGDVQPDHSEMFFGETGHDPRGTATDPDFKKMVDYSWDRAPFTTSMLPPDKPEQTETGGNTSYAWIGNIRRQMFDPVKASLKLFTQSTESDRAGRLATFGNSAGSVATADMDIVTRSNVDDWMRAAHNRIQMPTPAGLTTEGDQLITLASETAVDPKRGPMLTDFFAAKYASATTTEFKTEMGAIAAPVAAISNIAAASLVGASDMDADWSDGFHTATSGRHGTMVSKPVSAASVNANLGSQLADSSAAGRGLRSAMATHNNTTLTDSDHKAVRLLFDSMAAPRRMGHTEVRNGAMTRQLTMQTAPSVIATSAPASAFLPGNTSRVVNAGLTSAMPISGASSRATQSYSMRLPPADNGRIVGALVDYEQAPTSSIATAYGKTSIQPDHQSLHYVAGRSDAHAPHDVIMATSHSGRKSATAIGADRTTTDASTHHTNMGELGGPTRKRHSGGSGNAGSRHNNAGLNKPEYS